MTPLRPIVARLLLLAAICLGALVAGSALAQDPRATAAQAVAREWLAMSDSGDAEASWTAAGKKFQASIDVAGWREALAKARAPFGKTLSRAATSTKLETNPPGAPEGEYAVIVYETSFENATGTGESLTLQREADGTWRVIGYVIR
jgi:hypothetical protein